MKKINLYTIALATLILSSACESDDKVVDEVLGTYTSGAVLRTLNRSGSFDMFRVEDTFSVTIEEQDENNGELIDRVDITVDFVDNNKAGATGDDTNLGVAFGTIQAADFTIGERGLPTADFSYSMQEALTALGVDLDQVLPGDRIAINFELFFTDGRSFKASDAAVTVTGGSFFSSPFGYSLLIDDGIAFGKQGLNANDINLVPGETNESYLVNISIDDDEEGDLLETLNIYKTFRDLTIDEDNPDVSEAEVLYETYSVAAIPLDTTGVRRFQLEIPLAELLPAGVTESRLALGDDVRIRYELVAKDGRIITTDEPDTEYFDVVATTRCIQLNRDSVYPGEYEIEFADSFGDGWDGAFITVEIDGVGTNYTLEGGSSGSSTFTVPEGTSTLVLTYVPGSFEEEHSYEILDPFGSTAAADGPEPVVGEISLRVCQPED